jgi:DnaJ-class molecular chaperone
MPARTAHALDGDVMQHFGPSSQENLPHHHISLTKRDEISTTMKVNSAAICALITSASASRPTAFDVSAIPRGGGPATKDNSTTTLPRHYESKQSETERSNNKKKRRKAKRFLHEDTRDEKWDHEQDESVTHEVDDDSATKSSPNPNPSLKAPPKSPHNRIIDEILSHQDDYYSVLGITKLATENQITKAYRKRAVQTHPDKTGGDRRAFDLVSEAYDVLSDESKRNLYNRFGKRGLEQGGASGMSTQELFRSFFFGHQHQHPFATPRTMRFQLEVSLEDLYKGMTQDVMVELSGRRRKRVQIHIPPGMSSGETVVLSGELDDPNKPPGDLVFLVQQRSHDRFVRRGHDLALEVTITLQDALCGMERPIQHLDGRTLVLSSARHTDDTPQWIQTGDVHVLKGEGMPKRGETGKFGDLYIQYRVEMPSKSSPAVLSLEERNQLKHLLGKLQKISPSSIPENASRHVLQTANLSDFGRASGPFRPPKDEESQLDPDDFHARRSFYWSSNGGFGGHPFFGGRTNDGGEDGSNVQCQQM